jgi:diguanylate cyclase (GGDEF)-like protein
MGQALNADGGATGGALGRALAHGRTWAVVGALIILAGILGSWLAASSAARGAADNSRRAFALSSSEISGTLRLALQHEADLEIAAQAFVVGDPGASNAQFVRWATSVRALQRYPELQGIGHPVIVPASELASFAAAAQRGPVGPLGPGGTFQVIPPGHRSLYCFMVYNLNRSNPVPAAYDYCSGATGPVLFGARDSGETTYAPLTVSKDPALALFTPIYRSASVPGTVAGRRANFLGWIGMAIVPGVLLTTALEGHPGTAVSLHFNSSSSPVSFHGGAAPAGAHELTLALINGWSVHVSGAVAAASVPADGGALAYLIFGIAMSLLLAALIYVLGTGRARANLVVQQRTGELRFQALHDSLTGLANRALILDRAQQMLARARRNHMLAAAMFLDLDDFKDINDTLGHKAGDQLLVAVGARLVGALRESDTVGRLGGDEFVVLVEGLSPSAGAEMVAEKLLDVLATPFDIAESEVPLSVSASIGVATGDRLTPDELLRDADIALYRAKGAGKRCAVVFAPSMQAADQYQRRLEVDLRRALQADQFFLLYQPTIDLQTNAFTGVEALLRWQHPERGVVQPDDFIPALEASGLIVPVGAWVLETACRQGVAWHARGYRFTVSVNVSAKQLERDRIVDDVRNALSASGFDPTMLILELTETTLMNDVEETIGRLGLLKALGVRLAVDDFGTGYSSLAYLRRFPIDVLKIDRAFVSELMHSTEGAALVHTLVQLGKILDLETIAEGIEDDDQLLRLQAEKVDTGQGFLFSRPLDVEGVDRVLGEYGTFAPGPNKSRRPARDQQTIGQ